MKKCIKTNKYRKNKCRKKNKTIKRKKINKYKRNSKGGAPERITVNSYSELSNKIKNFPNDSRIWVVPKNANNALYESNKNEILESLYDHGITNDNINKYEFNIL
jgi:hypothetical protein